MKYIGSFDSIDGRSYRIEITTATAGADREIKLSGRPFVSSVSGDEKSLYSPIRCGGATVGLLSPEYIFDLYSGTAKGVKVTLYQSSKGDEVRWTGYVAPTIYNQSNDDYMEEISLDCVDGIAVLKDIPFREAEKRIMTFLDLIFYCLKESGCFRNFYISDNVQLAPLGREPVIEKFRISSSNFFDKRKDIDQTDDDVAWSCYDVLYHLVQWLGYTLTVHGEDVFIIDYDAIAAGQDTYHRYSLEGDKPGEGEYLVYSAEHQIKGEDYSANGASVSLDEVFNKVTVKDEFNTYDNLFPAFGDASTETNITAPRANLSSYFKDFSLNSRGLWFGDHIAASPQDGVNEDFFICLDTDWYGNVWLNVFKFMESPVFNMIHYDRKTRGEVSLPDKVTYGNLLDYNGAFYYRWYKTETPDWVDVDGSNVNDIFEWVRRQKASYDFNASTSRKLEVWGQLFQMIKMVDKIRMSPVIAFLNAGDNRFGPGDEQHYNDQTDNDVTKRFPFVTLKDFNSSVFGGVNHYLRIKGKVCSHDQPGTPHKLNDGRNNSDLKRAADYKRTNQGYIWGKLKWGDRWWNGTTWEKSECWFKLWFWDEEDEDNGRGLKVENYYDKDFPFKPNEFSIMNLGEDGILIPCPSDGNLSGKAELSFTTRDMWGDSRRSHWHPSGTKTDNFYCRYLSDCVFITDLEITAEIYEGLLGDADLDSDTLYTNVIDNGSVSSMPEILFKVCTDDGKKPSYSSVDFIEASQSRFVSTTYNKALHQKETGTRGCDGLDGALRQEEHYVFKNASHYESPRVKFVCSLHNANFLPMTRFSAPSFPGKVFILSEYETDYRFNSVKLTISEKE